MARSRSVMVLGDHRKLGVRQFDHWSPIPRDYLIITATGATAEQLEKVASAPLGTLDAVTPFHLATPGV